MLHVEDNQLKSMSTENITDLVNKFTQELNRRRLAKRSEAIQQFRKSFDALKEAGIELEAEDKYEGVSIRLYDFESFNFI